MPIDEFISSRKLVNLAFLVDSSMGQTILSSDLDKDGIPVYSATMDDSPFGYLNPSKNKIYLKNGDMVVPARGNSIGYVTLVNDHEATCTQTTIALKMICTLVSKYIYYYFKAYQKILFEYVGGAIPQITLTMISNIVIPLPPLQEQQRIVAKLDELFALIDKIEKEQDELEEYKKLAKEKVLELAVTGKLVKQDPNDEPASVLLERIKKEKEALVKAGKIKKYKVDNEPLSDADKNYYENIPDGWSLCSLNNLAIYKKGPFGSSLTKGMFVPESTPNRIKVYEQKNAIQHDESLGNYYITNQKYVDMICFTVGPLDYIVSCAGTIGEIYKLPKAAPIGIINQALMKVTLISEEISDYFEIVFYDALHKLSEKSKGTAIKNIAPFEVLKPAIVLIPPLEEQRRIINKLSTINSIIES